MAINKKGADTSCQRTGQCGTMANDLMESHFFHGLGANLWRGTSPCQIHTPSPTYMTPHAVLEPQPI